MAQAHQNWGHFVARSKSSLFGCPLCALDDIQSIDEADVRIVLNEIDRQVRNLSIFLVTWLSKHSRISTLTR